MVVSRVVVVFIGTCPRKQHKYLFDPETLEVKTSLTKRHQNSIPCGQEPTMLSTVSTFTDKILTYTVGNRVSFLCKNLQTKKINTHNSFH